MHGSTDLESIIDAKQLRDIYRSALGKLLFLAMMTRPDICTLVSLMASFAERPTFAHLQVLHDCARYLYSYKWPLIVGGQQLSDWLNNAVHEPAIITMYADASWRSSETTALTSRTGYVVSVPGIPLAWKSKDQDSTADSAAEAEIVAVLQGLSEAIWQGQLLKSINAIGNFFVDAFTDSDNTRFACNALVARPHKLIRAVPKLCTIRDLINKYKICQLRRVPGKINTADFLTKLFFGQNNVDALVRFGHLLITRENVRKGIKIRVDPMD